MPLFEVAVLLAPTRAKLAEGNLEKIILPPTPIVARDAQGAAVLALKMAKDAPESDLVRVVVRPFTD